MNNLQNNHNTARRALPFFVEFVKFATGFSVIIAVALLTLNIASSMR